MKDVKNTYKKRITVFKNAKQKVQNKLLVFSLLRLIVFSTCVFFVYQFWGFPKEIGLVLLLGVIAFVLLIRVFSRAKYEKQKLEALIEINQLELKTSLSDFSFFPNGEQYKNDQHEFSQDIDLFGEKSFFQYVNRTQLAEGELCLAKMMQANSTETIEEKQAFVKEMAQKIEFRQNFAAHAKLLETEESIHHIVSWLGQYKSHVPKTMRWLSYVFSVASILIITLFFTEVIALKHFLLWFFIGLGISGFFIKKTNALSLYTGKIQANFQQYSKLIELIEQAEFTSAQAKVLQQTINEDQHSFSHLLSQFSKQIDNLEQRNNMLLGVVLNGFCLWDLMQSYKIEQWILRYNLKVDKAFQLVAELDAWCSLGNFSFNHPDYTFPEIKPNLTSQIKVTKAIHPLLDSENAVANDIDLKTQNFVILTGANMAGKSTFLRTLALQIVMANLGLPVRAEKCEYRPIKLITSMRTADSLADESSYFYAELTRLKQIVYTLAKDNYFIILDEILKGTNSKDKAQGAQKFVKRLLNENAVGIIATHDLSLCTLTNESDAIKNYYFDAEIINNELYFDYTLKKGICQNMNASFLLEKMGLV